MVTRGEQHYSRLFHRWCAVAAPVMDANRQPIACIAISNCHDIALAEKLALVKFIVKDIEAFHRVTTYAPEAKRSGASLNGAHLAVDLTPRQHQVLTLFAKGLSYKQIARQLGIGSTKTVEEHLDAVRGKLHVSHRRECIQKAITLGLMQN
jgi:DNA-binding NarL/FixJ family response regulator